ncbi:hypothetical protein [Paenibacillus sp. O199]|uniref:hypothetical protein n=1 Tax=Paenibacillus sp. O199 TaxID=1643925 RepID=UPI0007BF6649|nr:hypothetical protein [Paenibacillus sp. O199]
MIIDNRIILGHGSILVSANYDGTIRVDYIDPNAVIGKDVTEEFLNNVKILRTVNLDAKDNLLYKLKNVADHNPIIVHGEYTLDFSKFNVGSVNTFIRQTRRALNFIRIALAC